MGNKIWIIFIITFIIGVAGFSTWAYLRVPNEDIPPKTEVKETVNYVSLGDSIAEGHGLPDYEANKEGYKFVSGSYTNSFKEYLATKYKNVNAINYANSGDDSTDLLNMLNALNGASLSAENQEIKNNLQNADYITICIGANDILGPVTDNLLNFLVYNQDITSHLDSGIETFNTNFPKILSKLQTLNSNAKLIFSSIYNPYKEFIATQKNITVSVSGFTSYNVTSSKLNLIGKLSETYIDSGNVYNEAGAVTKTLENGLNQIIENNIKNKNNCYLLDVKDCFDSYYTTNNNYNIVKADILSHTTIEVTYNNITSKLFSHLDPHPSELGHTEISKLLNNMVK